jgi:hypothetical protein
LKDKPSQYTALATSLGKCIKDIDREYASTESVYRKLIESAEEVVRDVVVEDTPERVSR